MTSTDSLGVVGRGGEDAEASSEEDMQPEAMVTVNTSDAGQDVSIQCLG